MTVVAIDPNLKPTHPIAPGGGGYWGQANDPGYGIPESGYHPVDPGYGIPETGYPGNPPRPTHPIARPGDPWWGADLKPTHPIVLPPTEPPPTEPPPSDSGHWVWAWSPQAGRWVWVKVPGEGEAGPK
jgi:hypothetical protein